MKKVLITDLDGTLIYSKNDFKMISKENVKMLKDYYEAGGRIVISTSRNANFSYSVEHKLGFRCDYVCNDGAYIELDGKTLSEHFISSQLVNDIKEEVNKNCFQYVVILNSKGNFLAANVNGANFLTDIILKFIRLFKRKINHEKIYFSNKYFRAVLDSEKIYSLHIYFLEKENVSIIADVLRRKFGDQVELFVTDRGIEVTAKGITKASGVKQILAKLKIDEKDAIVVGDSGNDVPMFEAFTNTFGMQNGKEEAIKKASNIINGFHELKPYLYEDEK